MVLPQQISTPSDGPGRLSACIDGIFTEEGNAPIIEVINPATEEVILELAESDASVVDKAVAVARDRFESGVWSGIADGNRQAVLSKAAGLIRCHAEELAAIDTACAGLPYHHSTLQQVYAAADWFDYYARYLETRRESLYTQLQGAKTLVTHVPVGVAALYCPWNIPLMSASLKLSAALAFGNSCVLKPSEQTPWSAIRLLEILYEAGLPTGVVNIVNGRGPTTGAPLCRHRDIRAISFTGGFQAGSKIASEAAGRCAKATTELGGKSANVIFRDCDIERALDAALLSAYSNNGQACLAGSRILIEDSIADAFIGEFVERAGRIRIGDPFEAATEMGPVVSAQHRDRVLACIRTAIDEGEQLLTGGEKAPGFDKGYYITPTVIRSDNPHSTVSREEIFGPVVSLFTFRDEEEAIRTANFTDYGLAAYLWTGDVDRAIRVSDRLNAGTVMINSPVLREKNAPFGGINLSGSGREGGDYSMEFFTNARTTVLRYGNKQDMKRLGIK